MRSRYAQAPFLARAQPCAAPRHRRELPLPADRFVQAEFRPLQGDTLVFRLTHTLVDPVPATNDLQPRAYRAALSGDNVMATTADKRDPGASHG